MGNDDRVWHLLRLLPRHDRFESFRLYGIVRMGRVVMGSRGGLEKGVVAKLVGLERAGKIAGGHEQK